MTSRDEHTSPQRAPIRAPKPALLRYLVAVVASAAGVAIAEAIFESGVSEQPIYAPLIAAAALTSWFGGFGPSALAIALCWTSALFLLDEPRGEVGFGDTEDMVRWWINLAFVLVIAGFGGLLRIREERSAVAADTARSDVREIESLQELMVALTGAVSSSDVARAVSSHSGDILSASGVALGLVDGEELEIVDPTGLGAEARPDGSRIELRADTLLTEAARTGSIAVAEDRADLGRAYPESDANLPAAVERALALPLRAEGAVIGSVEFLFERDVPLDGDTVGLARIVVDLAGQSLERARLYESERESRQALDRILEVAPRFLAEDTDDVVGVICKEARSTFGADYGVLWRVRQEQLELLAIDPPQPDLVGTKLRLQDFPHLRQAIERLGTSFVPDVVESTQGAGNDFVRKLGIRSSLRTPVVISGSSELVLAISWQVVVSEPDPATTAVVRRFADQAALALEQAERRRAEAEAARRADATRRLQEVTAALSIAATETRREHRVPREGTGVDGCRGRFRRSHRARGVAGGRSRHELGLWRGGTGRMARARSGLESPFRASSRFRQSGLGAVGRRALDVHRRARATREGVDRRPAHDPRRRSRRAAPLVALTADVHRGGACLAAVDDLAVRPGARAREPVRDGADDRGDAAAKRAPELASPRRGSASSRRATSPAAHSSTWEATGSTPSSCRTGSSASSWATWWAKACRQRPAWRSFETPSARSPSSA